MTPDDPVVIDLDGDTVIIGRTDDGRVTVRVDGAGEPGSAEGDGGSDGSGNRVILGRKAVPPDARRIRPGAWTLPDVALVAGCAASSALVTGLLLHVLAGSPGWVADLVFWYLLTLGLVYLTTVEQLDRLAAKDRIFTLVVCTGAVLLLAPLLSLLFYVLVRGLPNLRPGFFVHDLGGITPDRPPTVGGGLHAIIGTLEQAAISVSLVLPLGLLTAVFLNETRSAFRRPVRIVTDAMSGLPSIVAGLFIYSALIIHKPLPLAVFGFDGLMASLALSLVMLPTVVRTVEVVLRLVPDGLREASLALGASRARTVWSVVLPTARSGVTTAVVLGLARIVGETAPLLFTSFGYSRLNRNPFSGPQESLPLYVFRLVKQPSRNESDRGYVGAVVLIVLVLTLFYLARYLGRGRRPAGPGHPTQRRSTRMSGPFTQATAEQPPVGPEFPGPLANPVRLVGGPPPGAAELRTEELCAWFGDRLVLDSVDLLMPANRVTALIGPSGCGKSTYLRLLNRMHELVPSATMAGRVLLDGDDIYTPGTRAQKVRARIGMVFQKPNPFPAMTIRENVLSGLKLGGIRCPEPDALVEQSLVRAGLWREVRDRLGALGGALSGGQQQRLCIARALAVRPNVLLMDEPCSALDPTSTRRIEETIAELTGDVTVVIVTHNMQQANRVSDFCAFFLAAENEPGGIVEHGATDDMFNRPRDPRTLDYVNGRFG